MSGDHLRFELTHHVAQGRPIVQLIDPIVLQGWTVPARFRTDFASIPTVIRWLIPVFGRSCKAAVLHDWLCYRAVAKPDRSHFFLAQMLEDGVPKWQAQVQYLAVLWWPGSEAVTGEIVPP
jgi:hypothetical protein